MASPFTQKQSALNASQHGLALYEVLISLIVLSFGVLGALGFQTNLIKEQRSASYANMAGRYINEISERMRANTKALSTNTLYVLNRNYNDAISKGLDGVPNPSCGLYAANTIPCTSEADIAARNVYDWQQNLITNFPGAAAMIRLPPFGTVGSPLGREIVIAWREPAQFGTEATQPFLDSRCPDWLGSAAQRRGLRCMVNQFLP